MFQDVDRLHREVNGLKSTVSAQGKEVERLQRENQTLQGDMETHRLTVCPPGTAIMYWQGFYLHVSESFYPNWSSLHIRMPSVSFLMRGRAMYVSEHTVL